MNFSLSKHGFVLKGNFKRASGLMVSDVLTVVGVRILPGPFVWVQLQGSQIYKAWGICISQAYNVGLYFYSLKFVFFAVRLLRVVILVM